ncbi:MAG: efflux RND transporter permease subunit [Acidobacteria bacterium]|nr:efflux RND transporter permease subunit [Acidobacteriota bacterium]MBV9145001.1 efflux RND transporter permease subunit [Acidobacteriota bacterium]
MRSVVLALLRYRTLVLIALAAWIALGVWGFVQLDIEAYPDPSPPLVEIITQNPAWSAEEMEQQITVPLETVLNGMPHLDYVRSISIFGLSDVKLYFDFNSDYFYDRQEVLNRLQTVSLPNGLQPQLSPWSPIGEISRYQLTGANYSLNDLKATQDWLVRRELKQVPGVIDITTFGGTTKQYQAEVDPNKLLAMNVSLPQVLTAVSSSNANAGGNYLTLGSQNVNIRGIGLLHSVDDIGKIVITARNGAPVLLKDVANVHEGYQQRLGKVGVNKNGDAVEGIVLLQRGEESLPALKALNQKIELLNNGLLPKGMLIRKLYDRTRLIHITTATVRQVVLTGLVLVTVLLLVMLGDIRLTLITALTIPVAILFAFGLMVLTGRSANLISIGAIDFGILVDASIVVLEHIYRVLGSSLEGEQPERLIARATAQSSRPVLFSTIIILVAFVPLFTMHGVPGKIFSPMSVTYGFALTGALIFALLFAPVLASFHSNRPAGQAHQDTRVSRWFHQRYDKGLLWTLRHPRPVLALAIAFLAVSLFAFAFVGGEFMPALEEGNLWIRATLPQDISLEAASDLADRFRADLATFPQVTQTISQVGRPDDGTDVSGFNNVEISVDLKPAGEWPPGMSKGKLIEEMQKLFSIYPGVDFNFSQNIQDNVEEAMSGVKGENSLKLFGDDFDVLTDKANQIAKIMSRVRGVEDIGVFRVNGQPNLVIAIDRTKAARYGLLPSDVNAAIQATIGGSPVTQIVEGDRRFDMTVRYLPQYRDTPDAIKNILLPAPDGSRIPLSQIAEVALKQGAFQIYRENDKRYIPVKFSVRGRDLAGTIQELQDRLRHEVSLPQGYSYEWAGEFDSLRKEQHRLAIIVPISLVLILILLFIQFHSWKDSLIVLATLPFAATGGVWSLLISRTPFSISAAVGFTSLIGVATLGAVVFLSGVRRAQLVSGPETGLEEGSLDEMRPVLMACLAAGLGLLPAATSSGIGAQAQQPLARVVVGGMITTIGAVLFVLPLLARRRPGSGIPQFAGLPEQEEEELRV